MKKEDYDLVAQWIVLSRKLAERLPRNVYGGSVVRVTNKIEQGWKDDELNIPGKYEVERAKSAASHDHIRYR